MKIWVYWGKCATVTIADSLDQIKTYIFCVVVRHVDLVVNNKQSNTYNKPNIN